MLPSGVSPNFAHTCPEQFGGRDCLTPVNWEVVEEILSEMEAERKFCKDWGVPDEFAAKADGLLGKMCIMEITLDNVWIVFSALLPHM